MGYFDGIVDASFKTTEDGTLVFYPYGILGKGRILPDAVKKHDLRKKVKRLTVAGFIAANLANIMSISLLPVVVTGQLPWWSVLLLWMVTAGGLAGIQYYTMHRLVHGLAYAAKKLTLAESYINSAKSYNMVVLWVFEIMAIVFLLGSVYAALVSGNLMINTYSSDFLFERRYLYIALFILMLFGITLWGFSAYIFGKMIRSKTNR